MKSSKGKVVIMYIFLIFMIFCLIYELNGKQNKIFDIIGIILSGLTIISMTLCWTFDPGYI